MTSFLAGRKAALAMPAFNIVAAAIFGLGLWTISVSRPAKAQSSSCQNDFQALNKKLEGQVAALNALQKGKNKQMDPAAACPRLRNLAATERELLAFMKKEKAWCNIPDDIIETVAKRAEGTTRVAGQACKAASMQQQMRRQAQQGAQAGPDPRPKLPSGPL